MAKNGTHVRSAAEHIADDLREALLRLEIYPGSPLREVELADRYGVSRHTVRAGIALLTGEGVIVHDRHRGARVRELTAKDVNDVFDLRAALELEGVRLICQRELPLGGMAAAVAELDRLEAAEHEDPSPDRTFDTLSADRAVHRALIEASQNERLVRAYATIDTEIAYSYALCRITNMPLDDHEHRRILDALRAHDEGTAIDLLAAHIAEAREQCVQAVRPSRGRSTIVNAG